MMLPSGSSTLGGACEKEQTSVSRCICWVAMQCAGPELPVSDIIVGAELNDKNEAVC